ncbi:CAT RNA binding domain-containing protein, partial [Escherichia coli]|uniref:CAT RNA binding domain-containing protein n=1 Tax=Escherichia coli TaxID=562 RepID=UPI003904BA13
MIIEKVMNNNCVQASMNGQEVIISGPGVGYNKKYGMSVPEHPANRIFYVRNEQKNKLYKKKKIFMHLIHSSAALESYLNRLLAADLQQARLWSAV